MRQPEFGGALIWVLCAQGYCALFCLRARPSVRFRPGRSGRAWVLFSPRVAFIAGYSTVLCREFI